MNVFGDFRYVTEGGFEESARFGKRLEELFGDAALGGSGGGAPSGGGGGRSARDETDIDDDGEDEASRFEALLRTRAALFRPGGPLAQQFARHSTVLIVNDTVFAHGGLLPSHVAFGLDRINAAVSTWMSTPPESDADAGSDSEGDNASSSSSATAAARVEPSRVLPAWIDDAMELAAGGSASVVWNRRFAKEKYTNPAERYTDCSVLRQALAMVPGATRLVVGHTPQTSGCNSECDGAVWRIDVGLSRGVFAAGPQVLEIDGDKVRARVLRGHTTARVT